MPPPLPPIITQVDTNTPSGQSLPSFTSLSTLPSADSAISIAENTDPAPLDQFERSSMERRRIHGLEPAGYRPVWHFQLGYPGEVPDEIAEYLYPGIEKGIEVIGPRSSLFWLARADQLCDLIQDPAYTLEDAIEYIPHGAGYNWLIGRLFDDGQIPDRIMAEFYHEWLVMGPGSVSRPEAIPPAVSSSVSEHNTLNIFPFARLQSIPPKILCSPPSKKNVECNATDLENQFLNSLGGNLLFKGVPRAHLVSLMAFFSPTIQSSHNDNELGPGFYTTPSLPHALRYAISGAVLVFKDPDFRDLHQLHLSTQDWNVVVAFWTRQQVSNVEERIPRGWQMSDILEGAISTRDERSGRRIPGEETQIVGVSPAGVHAFASALRMIIWIE
ncbi:hypothetical protein N7492_010089 [Penicillium capsulatum]|uniref:Uncharacterized protein n=1 Tax=Penicillium capsulatum TaxID=69766 RepID=A0A9W9LEM4_9EURO|nr:hypothetical protein N7492_010089 [Penicillium capsulatum]